MKSNQEFFGASTIDKNIPKLKHKIINHYRFNKYTLRHKNLKQRKKSAIILHKNKMIHHKIVFPAYEESNEPDMDFRNTFSKRLISSTNMIKKKMNALKAKLSDSNINKELLKNSSCSDISIKSSHSLSNFYSKHKGFFTKNKLNKQVEKIR